jgi:hypothetical protein
MSTYRKFKIITLVLVITISSSHALSHRERLEPIISHYIQVAERSSEHLILCLSHIRMRASGTIHQAMPIALLDQLYAADFIVLNWLAHTALKLGYTTSSHYSLFPLLNASGREFYRMAELSVTEMV